MGKSNKNKIDAPINEEAQPEIVQPEELNSDEAQANFDEVMATDSDAEIPEVPADPAPAPIAKGKSKVKAEAPVIVDEEILSTINDRKKYTVIVVKGLPPLKPGSEKTVSGNVAKALIKKGFVKLKN